jgi:phosphatidylglycerophosphatase A
VTQRTLDGAPAGGRPRARAIDRVNLLLVSSGGLGYAPVASGTFGTLGGVAIALALKLWLCPRNGWSFGVAAAIAAAAILVVGVALGPWAEGWYRVKDPKPFVLDEVMGYLVAVLRMPPSGPTSGLHEGPGWLDGPSWKEMLVAFLAFRVFDVLKPWPARRLEYLPRGWGIMLDDLVAALYALAVVWVLRDYLHWH